MIVDKAQETTKLWATTKKLLKLTAALNGESMTAMAHRLIASEYKRVAKKYIDNQKGV